jgi:hypothetical protein
MSAVAPTCDGNGAPRRSPGSPSPGNVVEAVIALGSGVEAGSVALVGFGIDSYRRVVHGDREADQPGGALRGVGDEFGDDQHDSVCDIDRLMAHSRRPSSRASTSDTSSHQCK